MSYTESVFYPTEIEDIGSTLGKCIRAARLGFRELSHCRAWLRIQEVGPGQFRCEFYPVSELVPSPKRVGNELHCCWWEGDRKEFLRAAPFIARLKRVKKSFSVVLNNDGEIAR